MFLASIVFWVGPPSVFYQLTTLVDISSLAPGSCQEKAVSVDCYVSVGKVGKVAYVSVEKGGHFLTNITAPVDSILLSVKAL